MERINVRRPLPTDTEELHELITYTFAKEGLAGLYDGQKDDWEIKKALFTLQWDLESQGEKRFVCCCRFAFDTENNCNCHFTYVTKKIC
ncbi:MULTISPECIES: hypothetical protein [unclassified Lysinibacillus]|uniref:hypothetical protein n=1 Tax=unclassified Lysinibacillus TaxID=2636778 RepID=UPI00382D6B97